MITETRFWAKVDRDGPGGCWLWTGTLGGGGYGRFYFDGRSVASHRYAYELLIGPIPDGLTIDHLCRVRHCVNPAHLEPVTNRENILRGVSPAAERSWRTHCPRGHSDYMIRQGRRTCRVCYRYSSNEMRVERRRQQRARERAVVQGGRDTTGTDPSGVPTGSSPTAPAARSGGPGAPGGSGPTATLDAHWQPAFVDNDVRVVPTTREPVTVREGVL